MTENIKIRVARGARLFDEREPGWFKRVDVDRLDMLSFRDDILGQTWDGPVPSWSNPSSTHYDALFPDPVMEHGARHGFGGKSRRELTVLGDEWKRIVLARKESVGSV